MYGRERNVFGIDNKWNTVFFLNASQLGRSIVCLDFYELVMAIEKTYRFLGRTQQLSYFLKSNGNGNGNGKIRIQEEKTVRTEESTEKKPKGKLLRLL